MMGIIIKTALKIIPEGQVVELLAACSVAVPGPLVRGTYGLPNRNNYNPLLDTGDTGFRLGFFVR